MDRNELAHLFTYHPPTETQAAIYADLREWGLGMALAINQLAPDSPEKDLAVTYLRQAVMWANAAIACHGGLDVDPSERIRPCPADGPGVGMRGRYCCCGCSNCSGCLGMD